MTPPRFYRTTTPVVFWPAGPPVTLPTGTILYLVGSRRSALGTQLGTVARAQYDEHCGWYVGQNPPTDTVPMATLTPIFEAP